MQIPETLKKVAVLVAEAKGTAFLVGGAVRDFLMSEGANFTPKDFDVELHGISVQVAKDILSRFGEVQSVGESFGVMKLRDSEGIEFDFSLPRRENKSGNGHKGFIVEFDPTMTVTEACSRRDFTINSAMMNILTGELVDPFNAKKDIENKILRHTSPAFVEDVLRPLRAMQFAGRFGFTLAPETASLCKTLLSEFDTLPVERIWGEWDKWATKSKFPSMGLKALFDMGWEVKFPELAMLRGLKQEKSWHPEGDVLTHTALTCDAAMEIAEREKLPTDPKRVLLFAALCHDFGKPETTVVEDGKITSKGHDQAGEIPTVSFMTRIGSSKMLLEECVKLVTNHMFHTSGVIKKSSVRRLATRLSPHTNIKALARLIEADHSGRPPLPKGMPCPELLELAQELDVENQKPKPILTGKHLIDMGFPPGKKMGVLLKQAFEEQLEGNISDEAEALSWVKKNISN